MLLNIILYFGNSLCKYLVDLDLVSFVSWMAIINGGSFLFANDSSPGSAVFSVPQLGGCTLGATRLEDFLLRAKCTKCTISMDVLILNMIFN